MPRFCGSSSYLWYPGESGSEWFQGFPEPWWFRRRPPAGQGPQGPTRDGPAKAMAQKDQAGSFAPGQKDGWRRVLIILVNSYAVSFPLCRFLCTVPTTHAKHAWLCGHTWFVIFCSTLRQSGDRAEAALQGLRAAALQSRVSPAALRSETECSLFLM